MNEGFAEYLQYLGGYIPDIGVDFDRDATFFLIEHLVRRGDCGASYFT